MQFLSKNKKGKIISVIGRLEERDIFEYKEFGKISTKYSDYVIFTTDRNKSGISLALEGMTGTLSCDNYEVIYDRGKAIEKALEMKQKMMLYILLVVSIYIEEIKKFVLIRMI